MCAAKYIIIEANKFITIIYDFQRINVIFFDSDNVRLFHLFVLV